MLLLLFLQKRCLAFEEPLGISLDLFWRNLLGDATLVGPIRSLLQLLLIHLLVEPVHLAHLFNFIEIDDEAAFVSMVLLDALAAEHSEVVGAVKVLHALVVLVAQQAVDALLVFEVDVPQNAVPLNNFIEDVEIQRQFVHAFDLLHQLATYRAPNSEVVVQPVQALSAKGVPAVNQDARDFLAHVELFCAVVAEVETTALVVGLN